MMCSIVSSDDSDPATISSSSHNRYNVSMGPLAISQNQSQNYSQNQNQLLYSQSAVLGHQEQFVAQPVQLSSFQGNSRAPNLDSDSHDFVTVNISKPSPSGSNSSYFCRICHEGDGGESLVAPCKCTGTVALIHTSCLEHWLTTSNSDRCEICKFSYKIVREPRSCNEYLHDSANQFNVRNLIADIICFFLLTPLLIVSTYLCALGANQYFMRERWEAVGLIILSMFLLAVYFTWCHVTTRFHISMWKSWQQSNQQIRLVDVNERNCVNNNSSRARNRTPVLSPTVFSSSRSHNHNPSSQSRRMPFANPTQPFVPLDEELMDDSDTSRIIIV